MSNAVNASTRESTPPVACIIVNWNNWQDTSACLESLRVQSYPQLRVIVVDNGSTDGSLEELRTLHPGVAYIDNGYNAGFPKACNVGAAAAGDAEFLWFLNNDTVVPRNTLGELMEKAVVGGDGVVGGVLRYVEGGVQAWGGGSISRWTGYNTHYVGPAEFGGDSYITFASALVRREVFEALGGLFEGAFMYFEDADFCLRARAAGWGLGVAENTAILHKEGGSTKARSALMDRIITTSGLMFLRRHSPVPAVSMVLFLGLRIGKRIVLGRWGNLGPVLMGAWDWVQGRSTPFGERG